MKPEESNPVSLFSRELGPESIDALLAAAERDPAASDELDLVCDVAAAAQAEREALLETLDAARPLRQRVAWIGLAAAALLVAWIGLGRGGAPVDAVGLPSAPRYVPTTLRAANGLLAEEFAHAMQDYAEQRWSDSAQALSAFLERHPAHGPARFYRAASLEQLERDDQAELDYRAVAEVEAGFLGEHARWRLAQALLRQGRPEPARVLLRALADEPGAFAPHASAALEALDQER